jgi:putative flavoprotein involved in K+ transport
VHRAVDGWRIATSRGEWRADRVVVATGLNRTPNLPAWAAAGSAAAPQILHSSAYRGPAAFAGRDVLVVGTGNSGAEIATDLAAGGAARVRLAVRTGPNLLPRTLFGVPTQMTGVVFGALPPRAMDVVMRGMQRVLFGDVTRLGLPRPPRGLFTQLTRDRAVPILDVGLVAALAARRVEVVAAVRTIKGRAVQLADETEITPDAVIAATGYRADLASLFGTAVALDAGGLPRLSAAAEVEGAPGLYCAGYLVSAGGVLRAIARQAEAIAAHVANHVAVER